MPYRKTFRLVISNPAKADLQDIVQYTYNQYGEQQADIYMHKLYNGMMMLAENPQIGHSRNDIPENYKAFMIGKHIVIFTVKNSAVIVARIVHQGRDIKRQFTT